MWPMPIYFHLKNKYEPKYACEQDYALRINSKSC